MNSEVIILIVCCICVLFIISSTIPAGLYFKNISDKDGKYKYNSNDGSVSGDEYCRGNYENNGVDKNLKCTGARTTSSKDELNCSIKYNHVDLSYICETELSSIEKLAIIAANLPPSNPQPSNPQPSNPQPANPQPANPQPAAEEKGTSLGQYRENNGSVSGDEYCRGNYENNGVDKNLICVSGKDISDESSLDCGIQYHRSGLFYNCQGALSLPQAQAVVLAAKAPRQKYLNGNNGSVSGDEYCRGNYENNGKDKNLKCESGIDLSYQSSLDCGIQYARDGLSYVCGRRLDLQEAQAIVLAALTPRQNYLSHNNGSVSGDEYCRGNYENNGKDKNLKCNSGKDFLGVPLDCRIQYHREGLFYACGRKLNLSEAQAITTAPIKLDYRYKGNDGSVSGNEYCRGNYERPPSIFGPPPDKNLKCYGGYSTLNKSPVDCGIKYKNTDYACGGNLSLPEAQAILEANRSN